MDVQVISRDGQPEYAVLPWAQYQQLLKEAGRSEQASQGVENEAGLASLRELKAIREQAGLSIDDVARDAGISPHYLQMIESGEREASAVLKRALARALKISGWNNE